MERHEYRGYVIEPGYIGWQFVHEDYDGPEDNRCGTGEKSILACCEAIDEVEEWRQLRALETAGLRLELAASNYQAHCRQPATGDDDHDEQEFRRVEQPYEAAKERYREILKEMGLDAATLERRLSL